MHKNTKGILYEINTPVWLERLSAQAGKLVNLTDVPEAEIKRLVKRGVDTVWLMGVWERSPVSIAIGRKEKTLQAEFLRVLPDFHDQDFIGSAYSVRSYTVSKAFGGNSALKHFRKRLLKHGIGLILDFVPNHTAPDHAWVKTHPDYYLHGTAKELAAHPSWFIQSGDTVIANGRDPQYEPWSDVLQVNAFSEAYRQAAIATLREIAKYADGVRCDMAMLLLNRVFHGTWGKRAGATPGAEFWQEVIDGVHATHPNFTFIAEAYWATETELLQLGFDYCYDKVLYDLLLEGTPEAIHTNLLQTADHSSRLVRFLENHDEQRAARAYGTVQHKAVAAILATLPGLWLFHDGQAEGVRTKLPVHLGRAPFEPVNQSLSDYYARLFACIQKWNLAQGTWEFLPSPNPSVLISHWRVGKRDLFAVINYSSTPAKLKLHTETRLASLVDSLTNEKFTLVQGTLVCSLKPWQPLLLS